MLRRSLLAFCQLFVGDLNTKGHLRKFDGQCGSLLSVDGTPEGSGQAWQLSYVVSRLLPCARCGVPSPVLRHSESVRL